MTTTFVRSETISDASANLTHEPSRDPSWQESVVFAWGDADRGVHSFWRLGQEPVGGAASSSFGVATSDGLRFRHNVSGVPMTTDDRGPTHMAFEDKLRVDLDTLTITIAFPDCEGELQFSDYLPMFDYLKQVNESVREMGHHIEMPGRVTGRLRIGDRDFEIDGFGHRDRSWGERDWGRVRVTRWWPCVFGPDLSLHLLTVVDETATVMKTGYVYRDGAMLRVRDVDCVVAIDTDGLSTRSASGRLVLEDGETLDLSFTPDDSFVMFVRGFSAAECMGTVTLDGRVGVSHLEVCNNPTGGDNPIVVSVDSNNANGISRR